MNNNPIAIANYCGLNDQIERWSNDLYFVVVKLTMTGIIVPIVFVSAINYFLYQLGDESYFLPFPIVYVLISHSSSVVFANMVKSNSAILQTAIQLENTAWILDGYTTRIGDGLHLGILCRAADLLFYRIVSLHYVFCE